MYIVEKYLLEILVQYHQVTLPGIGTFSNHIEESSVDYLSGRFAPPVAEVLFDGRSLGSSDLLLHYIQKAESCSIDQAQALLERFLDIVKSDLEDGISVPLHGIGKIRTGADGHYEFIADPEGYIPEQFFGLPVIQFFPQRRSTEMPVYEPHIPAPVPEPVVTPIVQPPKPFPTRLVMGIAGILLLVVFGIFLANRWQSKEDEVVEVAPDEIHLNEKPSDSPALIDSGGAIALSPEERVQDSNTEQIPNPADPKDQIPESTQDIQLEQPQAKEALPPIISKSPVSPERVEGNNSQSHKERSAIRKGECLIMVGAFRDASNAGRMLSKVKKNGLQAFYKKKGDFTIVGVISPCSDIQANLDKAKSKLDSLAYALPQAQSN
ncbi:MAG: hypothetical protein ABIV51_02915 [Saprospiraceae bacterium]